MTFIKKLYKFKSNAYYLEKYTIFRNKREIGTIWHSSNNNYSTNTIFYHNRIMVYKLENENTR